MHSRNVSPEAGTIAHTESTIAYTAAVTPRACPLESTVTAVQKAEVLFRAKKITQS